MKKELQYYYTEALLLFIGTFGVVYSIPLVYYGAVSVHEGTILSVGGLAVFLLGLSDIKTGDKQ